MNFQLKLFPWPDPGPHVIALGKGTMDRGSITQVFRDVAEMTATLAQGKILIDLVDAVCRLESRDINELINEAEWDRWSANFRIAIVTARDAEQSDCLINFCTLLSNRGIEIAIFRSLKRAADWLAGDSAHPKELV